MLPLPVPASDPVEAPAVPPLLVLAGGAAASLPQAMLSRAAVNSTRFIVPRSLSRDGKAIVTAIAYGRAHRLVVHLDAAHLHQVHATGAASFVPHGDPVTPTAAVARVPRMPNPGATFFFGARPVVASRMRFGPFERVA